MESLRHSSDEPGVLILFFKMDWVLLANLSFPSRFQRAPGIFRCDGSYTKAIYASEIRLAKDALHCRSKTRCCVYLASAAHIYTPVHIRSLMSRSSRILEVLSRPRLPELGLELDRRPSAGGLVRDEGFDDDNPCCPRSLFACAKPISSIRALCVGR